jgi:Protein of unknown function (DUF4435)
VPLSFEDEIDASAVANEAIMLRTIADRTIMLVEGPSDGSLLFNFIDKDECEIIISYGHEKAITALEILRSKNYRGVLCIIDSDFSHFFPRIEDPDVIRTDLHDLETMMFVSPAFERVLNELGSRPKIDNILNSGRAPRDLIRLAAHPLGIIRHFSCVNRANLRFEKFGTNHISRQTLDVDRGEMITQVFRRSMRSAQPDELNAIRGHLEVWLVRPHNHWQMCCGHDLVEAFGKALQSVLGSRNSGEVSREAIEQSLRLAYSPADFIQTNMYARIRIWETNNVPYRCLLN